MVKRTSPVLAALKAAAINETAAVEFLEHQRWSDAPACPRCGDADVYKMTGRDGQRNKDCRWRCKGCKQMFTVRTGTIFEETRLPLRVWAFAFFRLLDTGASVFVIAAIVIGLILHGAMYGPQAAFLSEMFPTRIRYSGVSLAYQFTSILAGSLAPIIAIAILRDTGSAFGVAVYVAIASAVSFAAALLARETRGKTFAEIDREQ